MTQAQQMPKLASIEIEKAYLHFAAAHFTIFSATNRERLHGHNWRLAVEITGEVDDNGLCFDYAIYKRILKDLCHKYDEYTLIAEHSPYLTITEDEQFYFIKHDGRTQPLLKTDTIVLPIKNITIEELSHFFLNELTKDEAFLESLKIHAFEVRISSGVDQWGKARWSR